MWTIFQGDALAVLRQLPAETVHTCVTSPPYWGLRDYGVDGQLGMEKDPAEYVDKMVAIFAEVRRVLRSDGTLWLNLGDSYITEPHGRGDTHDPKWPGGRNRGPERSNRSFRRDRADVGGVRHRRPHWKLKHKDLVGMPWRVAFALQEDGWWLRRDVIWHKPNPMPESINDRPTSAHEYLFLFSKSGDSLYWTHTDGRGTRKRPRAEFYWRHRDTGETSDVAPAGWPDGPVRQQWVRCNRWTGHDYFYDADAIREPHLYGDHPRNGVPDLKPIQAPGQDVQSGLTRLRRRGNRKVPSGWDTSESGHRDVTGRYRHHRDGRGLPPQPGDPEALHPLGRNKRSVWTIPTQPFPEAHFATYPFDLVSPCIMAGTSAIGCCRHCGAPRERVSVSRQLGPVWNQHGGKLEGGTRGDDTRGRQFPKRYSPAYETRGWVPTCACPIAPVERCIVLDPFVGSGTTIIEALRLGRSGWGIDLSGDYCDMSRRRIRGDAPLFNTGEERDAVLQG